MLLDRERVKFWQKIVFGGLAAIFAISFVIGGVGSGTNFSLSDIFGSNSGGGGSSSGSSQVDKYLKQTREHPRRPDLWVALGGAYEAAGQPVQAAQAYERAVRLRPNDSDALASLASAYQQQGNTLASQAQALQQQAYVIQQSQPNSSSFTPGASSALGTALQSPIEQARASLVSEQAGKLQTEATQLATQAQGWYRKALVPYSKLTRLSSADPGTWIQYGLAAQRANETHTALRAYKHFLKIAPDDPDAASVRQLVKQLEPTPTKKASGSSSSGGTTTSG